MEVKVPTITAEIADVSDCVQPTKTRRLSNTDPNQPSGPVMAAKAPVATAAPVLATSAAAAVEPKKSTTRFGFQRKRPNAMVEVDPAAAKTAAAEGATGDAASSSSISFVPVNLLSHLDEMTGDLDAAQSVLKMKTTSNTYEFKAKISELQEVVRQLKGTLAAQIKLGRRVGPEILAPLQEDINGRLLSLSEQARMHKANAERANEELTTTRSRSDERGKKLVELREAQELMTKELAAHEERGDAEGRRADRAEALLSQREAELASATEELAKLKETSAAAEVAHAEASEAASAASKVAAEELASVTEAFEASKAEAAKALEEMTSGRDTEASRAESAEKQLAEAAQKLAALEEKHATLETDHAALRQASAADKARLESVSAQLEEKASTLKDAQEQVRDSIKNVTDMQKANQEVIAHERQRAQGLEDEARTLRDRVHEAERGLKEAENEQQRLGKELDAAKHELSTANASLAVSNAERERLAIETAEQKEKLQVRGEENSALKQQLNEMQSQLASSAATLEAKRSEAESLAREKHELDVAFKSYQEHHGTNNQEQMNAISELKLTVDRLSSTVEAKSVEASSAQGSLEAQQAYLREMEAKLNEQEAMRRQLHNQIQELKGNIRVFCRVRPGGGASTSIETAQDTKLTLTHKEDSHSFAFDKVFTPAATQEDVFAEVDGLVQSSLDGYKVCIFAYGQTGSGKTYTMQGGTDPSTWGLIPRALSKILNLSATMAKDGWQWTLTASFLEIYNESLRDLLHTGKEAPPSYAIKHDEAWGSIVANMGRVEVDSMEQINKLMAQAAKQRSVGSTDMNAQSSRSHSIFALYLKGVNEKVRCGDSYSVMYRPP